MIHSLIYTASMLRSFTLFALMLLACLAAHEGFKVAVLELKPISLAPQTTENFTLSNLDPSKSLMVTLQDHQSTSLAPFKLQMENKNHDKTECHFKYSTYLCVLETSSEEATISVNCLDNNCSATLIISQRTLVKIQPGQKLNRQLLSPGEVFKMQPSNFTSMLKVYSSREKHQFLAEQIAIFSNVHAFHLPQIEELDSISAQFGLKPVKTETEQYLFVDTGKVSKNQDLKVSLSIHDGQLYDSEPIVDFIETFGRHSKNNYTYVGILQDNLQLNLRVFAPRDNSTFPLGVAIRGSTLTNSPTDIRNLHLTNVDFRGQQFYDLSFLVSRSQHSPFMRIQVEVLLEEVEDRAVFIQVEVANVEYAEVTVFDNIFFGMEKNEQLTLNVQPQINLMLSEGDKNIYVHIKEEEHYSVSTQLCSLMKGCQIVIKTQERCESCSIQFDLSDETVRNNVLYYEVQADAIEGKVQIEQQLFFRYALAGHTTVRILVDSVNVILYANLDSYPKCSVPKPNCHQYVVNQHNPITITSPDDQPSELLLSLLGLETTNFKVHFLVESDGLVLKLGHKFTYIFDNEENSIVLKFALDNTTFPADSEYISFTLIAPLGALRLEVRNIDGQSLSSVDGFLVFPRSDIIGQLFEITVSKINQFSDDFMHMTLIASVDGATVRLDQTSTHYEKYEPGAQKKFMLEYEPGQSNALNIFTEDLEKSQSNMTLTVREVNDDETPQTIFTKIINKDLEFLNLNELLEYGDFCSDLNCELEISIVNSQKQALQQSITRLTSESVIALSDSIWSGFQINQLTKTSHFYFVPHSNSSTTIIFQTDDTHLYFNYRIHNTSASINPQDWPFLHSQTQTIGHITSSQVVEIPANNPEIQACWPTCVILINLNELQGDNEKITKEQSLLQTYKILATNSIIELPQDTKLEFALAQGQQKSLFIRVANFMGSPSLTFFTYFTIGQGKLTASLVSGDKQFALGPKNGVLGFDYLETTLPLYLVSSLISNNNLKESEVLLKVSIVAEQNLKMTVQFSSALQDIYRLKMDDLQMASLRQKQAIWYEFVPERDFLIKFYRIRGFPYLKVMRCDQHDYIECLNKQKEKIKMELQHILDTQEMIKSNAILTTEKDPDDPSNIQTMVQKTYEVEQGHCENCIFFLWVYCFKGDLQLSINVRTRYSQVELKEQNIVNDRIEPQKYNSYLINAVPEQETIITIRILEGAARVQIADRLQELFNETLNSFEDDYRDISVPPNALPGDREEQVESEQNEDDDEMNRKVPFALGKVHRATADSVLRHIHVTVTTTSEIPVQFLLSYSVGESSLFLEDGMVIQKRLQPNSQHTFYYHNINRKSHAYLTLSSQIQDDLNATNAQNELTAHFYYYPNANQRSQRQQFTPQLPPNRNQNYLGTTDTRVYELPAKFQLMELELSSKYNLRVTASINHKELIYLPLGFDYLIKLHPKENLYLVVNRPNTEYLELKVRKCDQSVPSIYYTNDAEQFKKGQFTTEVDIESANFKQYIKTKPSSKTIHLKIIGDESSDSMITVTVSAAAEQKMSPRFRAGNKGFLNYQIMASNQVEVSFKPITCDGKPCSSPVIYYLLLADNIQEISNQLNCAGNRFISQADILHNTKHTDVITVDEQNFDTVTGDYHYKLSLENTRAFVGLKAVVADTAREEVTYIPLQISSLLGQLDKVSAITVIITAIYTVVILAIVVTLSTRFARRGYRPIASEE